MRRTIWFECELRKADGSLVESSTISFTPGRDRILPALERRLRQLAVGEEARGELRADEAFGDESLLPVTELPRQAFPADAPAELGRRYQARTVEGKEVEMEIVALSDERVSVRFLHPLADESLAYRVKVLAVEGVPPPLPAAAVGIDSAAIQLDHSAPILVGTDDLARH